MPEIVKTVIDYEKGWAIIIIKEYVKEDGKYHYTALLAEIRLRVLCND